jgi:hypothetical protein
LSFIYKETKYEINKTRDNYNIICINPNYQLVKKVTNINCSKHQNFNYKCTASTRFYLAKNAWEWRELQNHCFYCKIIILHYISLRAIQSIFRNLQSHLVLLRAFTWTLKMVHHLVLQHTIQSQTWNDCKQRAQYIFTWNFHQQSRIDYTLPIATWTRR